MIDLSDPKKIRGAIRRYERKLRGRDYRDGGGTRFLLGPFYLILDDIAGSLAHYRWFEERFPDSSDEPFHALGWALTASACSGNVFRDLGRKDADVEQFKAILAAEIIKAVDRQRLTVRAAQRRTGIAVADFSHRTTGHGGEPSPPYDSFRNCGRA